MDPVLSETTRLLARPGAVCSILRQVAHAVIPAVADFAFIHLVDGAYLRCAAAAHATRPGRQLVRAIQLRHRIRRTDPVSSVAQVVRTGRAKLRSDVPGERAGGSPRDAIIALHHRLATRSAIVVPLAGTDGVFGAMTLCYAESGRRYTEQDLRRARRLADQVAAFLRRSAAPTPRARRLLLRARA